MWDSRDFFTTILTRFKSYRILLIENQNFFEKGQSKTYEDLGKAINLAFDWIFGSDILEWFQHCGYVTT
jgi:hypothetical protein